jgi:hypothetical protein
MKLKINNLKKHLKGMSVIDFTAQFNYLQKLAHPKNKPITRQTIYTWTKGHTPPAYRIYMTAAILKCNPKELVYTDVDSEQYEYYRTFLE